jgi:hypothetical protein
VGIASIGSLYNLCITDIANLVSVAIDVIEAIGVFFYLCAAKVAKIVAVQVKVLEAWDGATSCKCRYDHRQNEKKCEKLDVFH